jgi:thiol-disulfide isomerase/thioredoxin
MEMEARSDWYNRTATEINLYKDTSDKKVSKKYKLDLLLRVANRVDEFASYCGECQMFQQEVTALAQDLGNLIQLPGKERRRSHIKKIDNIVKHLKKEHKLITEGYYRGMGMIMGPAIGTGIGAASDNTGMGIAIGVAIGIVIGNYLDKKAEKEGRVI